MNKSKFVLAALILTAPLAARAQQLPRAVIAIVDRDEIVRTCTQCQAANRQLQAQAERYRQREEQLGAPLRAESDQIEAALRVLAEGQQPDAALQARIAAYQARQQSAAIELAQLEEALRRNRAFVVQQIIERVNPLIDRVMRQRGANLALEVGATYAHGGSVNITTAVLQLVDANTTPFNVTAPVQQQQSGQPQP